jgi:6-phosphogluconolactonase
LIWDKDYWSVLERFIKMSNRNQIRFETTESDFPAFAATILKEKLEALQLTGRRINIALSGGSTPLPVFHLLKDFDLKWELFSFFMVDERFVSVSSNQCNYFNINNILFRHIPSKSYAMIKADESIETAVEKYELLIDQKVPKENGAFPVFDFILLGMGDDGHIASLFPNTEALEEQSRSVTANFVPSLDSHRITLTYPVIQNATEAMVLVKGKRKTEILDEIYNSETTYPVQKLVNSNLKLTWIIGKSK